MKRITFSTAIAAIALICFFIIIVGDEDCDICYTQPVMIAKLFFCGLVIVAGSVYFKRKYLKTENLIFDIESEPLLETNEATADVPFAGEGVVEAIEGKVLSSVYTAKSCVYYHSIKEKYVRQGKSSHWEVVENIARFVPFYVRDERGVIKVDLEDMDDDFSSFKIPGQNMRDPENSEIDCDIVLNKKTYNESLFAGNLFGSKFRQSEFILVPGTKVFIYGIVSEQGGEKVLREGERQPLIISKKNRDEYVHEFYKGGNLVFLAPLLMMIGFTISFISANYFLNIETAYFVLFFFFGNSFIAASVIVSLYNRIIGLRMRALNALSNIDVELKRRADLIPSLVSAVKGYVKHEKEVQSVAVELRAKTMFTKEYQKSPKISVPSLVAVVENYPDLRASENFLSLMTALVDTEERIAYSREFYNRSVRKYNTLIRIFPFVIVSVPMGMNEMEFLSIDRSAGNVPEVHSAL